MKILKLLFSNQHATNTLISVFVFFFVFLILLKTTIGILVTRFSNILSISSGGVYIEFAIVDDSNSINNSNDYETAENIYQRLLTLIADKQSTLYTTGTSSKSIDSDFKPTSEKCETSTCENPNLNSSSKSYFTMMNIIIFVCVVVVVISAIGISCYYYQKKTSENIKKTNSNIEFNVQI